MAAKVRFSRRSTENIAYVIVYFLQLQPFKILIININNNNNNNYQLWRVFLFILFKSGRIFLLLSI